MHLGIDLGGTNIAAGLVDSSGKILARSTKPTLAASRSYSEITLDIINLCHEVLQLANYNLDQIASLGLGVPGTVDHQHGIIIYANNFQGENFPLAQELSKFFPNLTINLENDANAATYGEYFLYCQNHSRPHIFLALTLGTGVGGGLILDNKIYRGFNNAGAEFGHSTLVHDGLTCSCGKKGCFEMYASVNALIQQTRQVITSNPSTSLAKNLQSLDEIDGKTIFNFAARGDSLAQHVIDQYLAYLADGITSLINIFQPEILVIGGGISREGDKILHPIQKFANQYSYDRHLPKTKIQIAQSFNDAGIIGAALAGINQ